MLCLSYKGTANLIKQLTKDYDPQVLQWQDKLQPVMPVSSHLNYVRISASILLL